MRPVNVRFTSRGPQVAPNPDVDGNLARAFAAAAQARQGNGIGTGLGSLNLGNVRESANRPSESRGGERGRAANQENPASGLAGIRAKSTQVRNSDGTYSSIINIGVPEDHPLADRERAAGTSGLYGLRVHGVQLPEAPEFVVNVRRGQEERKGSEAPG